MGQWLSFELSLPLLVSGGSMTATGPDFTGSLMNVLALNVPVMQSSVNRKQTKRQACDRRLCLKDHDIITRGWLVHFACGNSKQLTQSLSLRVWILARLLITVDGVRPIVCRSVRLKIVRNP